MDPDSRFQMYRHWSMLRHIDHNNRGTSLLELLTGEEPADSKASADDAATYFNASLRLASDEGLTVTADGRKQALAALAGTLIHRQLESCVQYGTAMPEGSGLRNYWRLQLRSGIADSKELEATLDFIEGSVERSLAAESAWIFDAGLRDSEAELGLSSYENKRLRNYLLDRCFIDAEGTRWIIDYKSATADANQSERGFIDAQVQLHSAQLNQYKKLFAALESRPTKTALYLTSIAKLVELGQCSDALD
ncbi:MAG: PD-(D/E)XK nuclease family protein [Proteobacteria bacterium]|nr:PD-(D/E)XK nuclease family protein [Pseudomonadota bacterium]